MYQSHPPPPPAGPQPQQHAPPPPPSSQPPRWEQPYSSAPPPQQQHYPPPVQHPGQQMPPHQQQQHPQRPEMGPLPPPGQYGSSQDYRLPAPQHHGGYYPPGPDPYGRPPQHQQAPPINHQTAPRQRTAIACRYCRKRKIRCSGFENSEDGRCSNCIRFNQECVFTPVSAQTQAFVPVQAVRTRPGPGMPLYGSYGQPLRQEPYPGHYSHHPPPPGYQALPSPSSAYPPPPHPGYNYGQQQPPYESQHHRGRGRDEPHTPTLPHPGQGHDGRSDHNQGYNYPDPSQYHSNGHPPPGAAQAPYPPQGQPYYPPQPGRRTPPPGAYPYEQPRNSHSPYGSHSGSYSVPPPPHPSATPNQPGNARQEDRPSPPNSTSPHEHSNGRNGMSISSMVHENGNSLQNERNAADSNMVSQLNRTSR